MMLVKELETENKCILVDKLMDNTTQIKNNLITRINDSTDIDFLKALQTIFDSNEKMLFGISSEQQNSIDISRQQIFQGKYIVHNEVMDYTREWLRNQ